ncbi:alkyl sulfatase [Prauserella marina]|uniref:Alkyl sulfatase BDS1, metallo-beta-lactamase superfamily n=1 Tax=Prauserella marina TaxID=530584 RepID=A0A222VMY7_9PSEU|nr:alkyl sulfatase dimerization domain-containing protein [Prauserella marina]ASR35222.1 alkyl sulfatase [Prauserella marina]PWV85010.1 alkyl sulfatase BDS1-like metallo-beta-lactamase superfamily hydrolase [Prauserella marina]SDC06925.1 Alkyl sulfatase BDS1, metallo-beta-lactamase superfamily [Prauserella marina]
MSALPFADTQDFNDAERGFVAALSPGVIKAADGRVVWDNDAYDFLNQDCPDTAHPSLWRQGQLCAKQGLFEVTDGIYQVRGFDLSNMTLVEGKHGVVVIDPLISVECAEAALAFYREHRGDRPVTGLIYTHSHGDHFGGARGVLPEGSEDGVPIIAPEGFLEHAVSENVYAGNAMTRRAMFMYGDQLPKGPAGQIGCGLGMTTSTGSVSLIAPTVDITHTGQEQRIDGVHMIFQLTPGTEAPAEMNFLFPDRRALCLAENATHNMHNVLTLRGALVRDARVWARYLDEAIDYFAGGFDLSFASHHWPTWGADNVVEYLSTQRDLYAYLHDQTLRMLNEGLTGPEIAEALRLPPALENAWHARGYYGSLNHNVKAIYQRYLGWFDGNPAHLWEHPPAEQAARYVESMGGVEQTLTTARGYVAAGDPRFAATLLNHVVFAEPDHRAAREELAGVYDQLGAGAENGTWRNFYLSAATELRHGAAPASLSLGDPEMMMALTVEQLLDSIAIRVDGPRAWDEHLVIDIELTDERRRYRILLRNGVLTHRGAPLDRKADGEAGLTLTLTKPALLGLIANGDTAGVDHDGDLAVLDRLRALLTTPDPGFDIVTP